MRFGRQPAPKQFPPGALQTNRRSDTKDECLAQPRSSICTYYEVSSKLAIFLVRRGMLAERTTVVQPKHASPTDCFLTCHHSTVNCVHATKC
jgi:hypothetical protein